MKYLLLRLKPLYIFSIILEVLFTLFIMVEDSVKIDWSPVELAKTFTVLFLTTSIAFLYMMVPYIFYLLVLPARKQNSKLDKTITLILYTVFVYCSIFEEVASLIFWDEFESAFNFIAVDYLVYTHEVISNIEQSYPIFAIITSILTATLIITRYTAKYLLTQTPAQDFFHRLCGTLFYACVCVSFFFAVDITKLEWNTNNYNNELAKEGTYSLFSAFLKNEISYDKFYLTRDKAANLKLLQSKLASKECTFSTPKENITRFIKASKPEKKANVIIVLMESMSAKFLDENRASPARKITPNLTRLSQQGLYFSHVYANGTRSVRGIEALTLSVPPLPGMSIVRRPNNENLYNIGSIFRDKGYDNKWIYGGYGYFDNMNYFFEHNGFQVIDRAEWDKNEVTFANAWGAADEDTFAKVIKEADKSFQKGKPFFTFLLTISNHRPFTYPEGRIDLPPLVSRRDGGVKYADYAIGRFIDEAQQKPWFDNTVFVFIADHTAGAAGKEEINLEGHHIPLIIYAPKLIQAQRIDIPISQIDALPTLLGLLNFNYESRFYGQDVLKSNYNSRFFVSNYQKIGYVKNGVDVILKPVKQYSYAPKKADKKIITNNLEEAIAFYQQASDWTTNLKE